MSVTTVWTHGNALVVEDTGEYAYIRHRGWGTELSFAGPRDDEDGADLSLRYCHVPISTPGPVDGETPALSKLTILYETSGYWQFQRIDVWDGNNPLAQINQGYDPSVPNGNARGRGEHLTPDAVNQFTFEPPLAVSLAVGVTFACQPVFLPEDQPGGPNLDPEILTLAAIGAEFTYGRHFVRPFVATETVKGRVAPRHK